ncbi:hypothetical protein [Streptomyces xiamenensis]|uniref:hypothetical protein n=1 Tax=Streptomyces xiamenensis TaxID=408015 RepID=UPI0037D9323A
MTNTETRNAVSILGGRVHQSIDIHGTASAWPWCRTGTQDSAGTRYQFTDKPVTCRNCLMYIARRAEAARLAAASPLAAAAYQLGRTVEDTNAERAKAPTQPTRTGPTYTEGDRISVPRGPASVISHVRGEVAYSLDSQGGEWFIPEDSPDLRPLENESPATTDPRPVIEGVIVEHSGTAQGSRPADATHPDVIAARAALDGNAVATMTDHHDTTEPTGAEQQVRGYLIEPRNPGTVRVYWLEGGTVVTRETYLHGAALDGLADRLTRRGWHVWPLTAASKCVIADRPAPAPTKPDIPMSVGYVNRRDGEECAQIEISGADLAALTAGDREAVERLRVVIAEAAARFN